jgi:hypothetical protein
MIVMLLRIDTVNGMTKSPKNHPQMMAHHNLFNLFGYTTCYTRLRNKAQDYNERQFNSLNEYYAPLTLSFSR